MKWLPTLCKNCIAKLWMVGLIAIVLIALTVSAVRATLPYLNQYQPQVSQYLAEHYNIDLTMSSVKGYWHDGGPLLVVEDLGFDNQDALGVSVTAPSTKLHIDLLETALSLSPRFKLIEVESPVIQLGDFSQFNSSSKPATNEDVVLTPLLSMARFASINNATIKFSKHYGELPDINIAKVAWHDDLKRRQLQLSLTNKLKQQPLSMIVDISGETLKTLKGQAYLKAEQWAWLENLKPVLPQIKADAKAVASFEFWASFSASQLDSMVLQIGDNTIDWLDNKTPQTLTISPELIQWLPNKTGWVFEASALQIQLNDTKLAPINIYANQKVDSLNATIASLNIGELLPISSLLSSVDKELSRILKRLAVVGTASDLNAIFKNEQWHYQGKLNELAMANVGGIPGIKKVNGTFSGVDNQGQLSISVNNQALDFGEQFKAPLKIDSLTSHILWNITPNEVVISSPSTLVSNNDLGSNLSWQVSLNDGYAPQLTLLGGAQVADVKHVADYLPQKVLGDDLVNYLSGAIQKGRSKDVSILWHGALDKFPYKNGDGAFEVVANVENLTFEFDDSWQPLTKTALNLQFKNEGMLIEGIKGQLDSLSFESLTVAIDDLLVKPVLSIDTHLIEPQSRINNFVFASPIDDSLGAVLRQLSVTGNVDTTLNIQLPLHDKSPALVSGVVKLANNDLSIESIELDIGKVSGDIKFTDGDIETSSLTGMLYEQPVDFDVTCKSIGNVYGVDIDLAANWHTNKMPSIWQQYLNPYIDGSLDWKGKVTLQMTEGDVKYQAAIKSPMTGLALKLPKPLDKYVDQKENLLVTSNGNVDGGQFNLALGSRAEIFAKIDSTQSEITIPTITLLVGRKFKAQDYIATEGMSLNIDLDTLAIDEWNSFINNIEKGQSKDSFFPELQHINANVAQLNVSGLNFDTVSLAGHKMDDYWQIDFDSIQSTGVLKVFDDFMVKGIEAKIERLNIDKESQTESKTKATTTRDWLRDLPPIAFDCQQCQLMGVDLGQVSFDSIAHLQGLAINNIKVRAKATSLDAKAIWGFDSLGEYTNVSGQFNSDNIESTLALLDYSSSIRDSDVKTDFNLTWRDNIYSPDIESLEGDTKWEFGEGHIAEVSDQGARIFSLFSLDSLRRKLVLDFRDVFQEGIFFNDFKGDFVIKDGIAVTTNAYMDGVAGGVDVVGSINLSTQELDYYISFAPRLFSNLPVIAGVVASQPQIFVLTFAITKVLEPIVDVISQVNFKLSGNVDNPDFKEVNRKQKKYKVPPHILEKAGIPIPPIEGITEQSETHKSIPIDESNDAVSNKPKIEVKTSL